MLQLETFLHLNEMITGDNLFAINLLQPTNRSKLRAYFHLFHFGYEGSWAEQIEGLLLVMNMSNCYFIVNHHRDLH